MIYVPFSCGKPTEILIYVPFPAGNQLKSWYTYHFPVGNYHIGAATNLYLKKSQRVLRREEFLQIS